MNACLSEFALDDLALHDEASSSDASHLSACAECQQRRRDRRVLLEDISRERVVPLLREAFRRHTVRRRRRWQLTFALPSALALACGLIFFVTRREAASDSYVGGKGAASVVVHCRRAGKTFLLAPGDSVHANDELRFVPHPSSAASRYVLLSSIDGTGRYTPFYPADAGRPSLPLPAPGEPLPGSIRLDNALGPERIFFAFSVEPLPGHAVKQVAEAKVAHLEAVDDVGGSRVESGWIVLPKLTATTETP